MFKAGQLVLMNKYFNRKSPAIVIELCKDTRPGWYYVFDVVEQKRTLCHKHSMTLFKEAQSGV
jgi:hypothetical protein